jgi:DNA-binding NtrC family response regulator
MSTNKSEPSGSPLYSRDGGIDGYVLDNMEGAVDQASFLARLDVPIAVIGPPGTGKMYIAKVVHQESGGQPNHLIQINCREFRNKSDAIKRIQKELTRAEGKTLVFKSPHLMSIEAQVKLARQISSRTLADVNPARYLPDAKLVALFPEPLEHLMKHAGLNERLASAFAGFPINVPPIKDRKQAVLRWADKILGQECIQRDRKVEGFTAEAEEAMLAHPWLGNISEMRQRILQALDGLKGDWVTPMDLGIYKGGSGQEAFTSAVPMSFLESMDKLVASEESYTPSALEQLDLALAECVNYLQLQDIVEPLGEWLHDELVLAAIDRFRGGTKSTAEFLQTNPRNIGRWSAKIEQRESSRYACMAWNDCRRLSGEWVRECSQRADSPLEVSENMLLQHLEKLKGTLRLATRAKIMGMSAPTYQKRVREYNG